MIYLSLLKYVLYPPPNVLAARQKTKERGNDYFRNEIDLTASIDFSCNRKNAI